YRRMRWVAASSSSASAHESSVRGNRSPSRSFTLSTKRPASSACEMSPRKTRRVSGDMGASFSSCQNSGLRVRILAMLVRTLLARGRLQGPDRLLGAREHIAPDVGAGVAEHPEAKRLE